MNLPRLVIILLAMFFCLSPTHASENLLYNPDFEVISDGFPVGWKRDTWIKDRDTTDIKITSSNPFRGNAAVVIITKEPDDAKLIQDIAVHPNSLYLFRCKIRAEGIPTDSKGANISVLGIPETSEDLHDTKGQWQEVTIYGKTGYKQTNLTFGLRIGGYGSLNKGKAEFDDCIIKRVDSIPLSARVINLFKEEKKQVKSTVWGLDAVFLAALFFLLLGIFVTRIKSRLDTINGNTAFLTIITICFVIRIMLAYNSTGFPVDINTYKAWAEYLATKGFSDFYTAGHFIDYPPLYMYVFYLLGKIRNLLGLSFDADIYHLLLKLPSLIAEVLSMFLIINLAKKKGTTTGNTIISLALFAFNPVVIIDSALWGQIDSFLALFILGFLIALIEKRLILASVLFALSIMIKPQGLVFTPIFVAYLYSIRDIKAVSKACVASMATILPLILPFSINEGFMWIPKLLNTMFTEYPYATLNTFNFYALIGKNWSPIDDRWFFLSFRMWGFIAVFSITLFSIYLYIKSRYEHKIVLVSLIIVLSVFMFSVKMHERYMVTSMVIFALAFVLMQDKKLIYLFIAFTITNTFNLGYPLILAHNGVYHISPNDFILRTFSFINLVLYIIAMMCFIPRLLDKEIPKREKPLGLFMPNPIKSDLTLNKKDIVLLTTICTFFTVLYLYNLGSMTSPQTYWQPKMKGEAFMIDLKNHQDIKRINYFSGIGNGTYRLDISDDLLNWKTVSVFETKEVFQWKYIPIDIKTRYIIMVVTEPGGTLYEVGLFDRDSRLIKIEEPKDILSSQTAVGSFKNLFDEQDTVPYSPSYKNGTYFDEIYYARTAFEHIHDLMPYEITHPPLGKLIIASGIKMFGMTPFGWRFMGALSGVVIIAFVYLLGRMLFGSIKYGLIAAILIGFDFMTFVQARLATIDSLSVMFIVLMTFFMMRFYFADSHRSMLINLTFSAIFFSLGISTKWLCIYTGIGLAIVFFYKLYHLSLKTDIKRYILYGGLLFVILPILVYTTTYLFILPKPISFKHFTTIVESQYQMFQYHKHIIGSHPFASRWWQWPIIYKPMWLYMAPDMLKDKAGSIVTMGNPLVWWTGLVTTLMGIIFIIRNVRLEPVIFLIIVFIGANYLPWALVPRETYIYHFFATLPFWVLSITYYLRVIDKTANGIYLNHFSIVFIVFVVLMFCMFYPILSGLTIDKSYINAYLRWFDTWIFFHP
ncbi:MAG: glycosyltransferase family 39 protein [Thermodesulfovibrionales bacterium]